MSTSWVISILVLVSLHLFFVVFGVFFFRIVVSSSGIVYNLCLLVCLAGLRTVLCTKNMLNKLRCLGSRYKRYPGTRPCDNGGLLTPRHCSLLFEMRSLRWQGSVSSSPIRLRCCSLRRTDVRLLCPNFQAHGASASFTCTRFTRELGCSHDLGVGRKWRPGVMLAASVWLRRLPYILSRMHVGRCQSSAGYICLPTCAQKGSGDIFTQELWPRVLWGLILNGNSDKCTCPWSPCLIGKQVT